MEFASSTGTQSSAQNNARAHAVEQSSSSNMPVWGAAANVASTSSWGATDGTYNGNKPKVLEGFSDADWAGDLTTHRSTSGFVLFKNNATISRSSQLQPTVAHSTANAEYCALSEAGKEAMYLRVLERSITGKSALDPTVLHEDN